MTVVTFSLCDCCCLLSLYIEDNGYHLVGCKIGANAIRLHDEVVAMVAKLFRSLRLDAIVEPLRLFSDADEDASNQRPDIFIRNPRED